LALLFGGVAAGIPSRGLGGRKKALQGLAGRR
jgi:hypothetical protein